MQYQVARNGQTYGPYTLDDLQRYVASGNVLLTDLAKSDEMADWLPVSQILGEAAGISGQGAAPVSGAYASTPVQVDPALAGNYGLAPGAESSDPPNLSWVLVLLFAFFTCGIFAVVWNLVLAAWFNRIEPARKILTYYIIATVLVILNLGGSYGSVIVAMHHGVVTRHPLASMIGIGAWVARLIARFTFRSALEDHYNRVEPLGLRLSGVMTFFFGCLYFQYHLNRINEMKQALRYRTAPR